MVVLQLPALRQHPRLGQVRKLLHVQQLVAQPAVERLRVAVLPRRPRRDVQGLGVGPLQPTPQRPRDELRSVVAPQMPRHATHDEQLRDHIQHILGRHAPRHHQRQTFTRVLIDDRQPLQRPPARRAVEDKVPGPHVVWVLRATAHASVGAVPQMPLFPGFLRHFQPLPAPQPIHALAIHRPALTPQQRPDPPIAITRMLTHQRQHPFHQPTLRILDAGPITLRLSRLTQHPARPSLAHPEAPPHANDRLLPACRTRQFPSRASLSMALSNPASASSFFRRLFSSSSSLSRLASSAFMPPYWFRQRWKVASLIPRAWQTSPIVRPAACIPSASRSLVTICAALCRVRFIESPPGLRGLKTLIAPGPVFGEQTNSVQRGADSLFSRPGRTNDPALFGLTVRCRCPAVSRSNFDRNTE